MQFMTSNSPIRSARKIYHEQKREERRQKQLKIEENLVQVAGSAQNSQIEITMYD